MLKLENKPTTTTIHLSIYGQRRATCHLGALAHAEKKFGTIHRCAYINKKITSFVRNSYYRETTAMATTLSLLVDQVAVDLLQITLWNKLLN